MEESTSVRAGVTQSKPIQIDMIELARQQDITIVFKANKPSIEQPVDMRREQEPVCSIKSLNRILAETPRLDMARY